MPETSDEELTVAWVDAAPARIACEKWHYAGIIPAGKSVRIGIWEGERFVGVVVFSLGASPFLGKRWGLEGTEVCELTRVALREHRTPVTQILRRAIRLLTEANPGLRMIVSFADPKHGHLGTIYQAGNWIYTGESGRTIEFWLRGRWRHVRGAYREMEAAGFTYSDEASDEMRKRTRITRGKYRYVFPLDKAMRRLAEKHRQPYPKDLAASPSEGLRRPASDGRFDPEQAASPFAHSQVQLANEKPNEMEGVKKP